MRGVFQQPVRELQPAAIRDLLRCDLCYAKVRNVVIDCYEGLLISGHGHRAKAVNSDSDLAPILRDAQDLEIMKLNGHDGLEPKDVKTVGILRRESKGAAASVGGLLHRGCVDDDPAGNEKNGNSCAKDFKALSRLWLCSFLVCLLW